MRRRRLLALALAVLFIPATVLAAAPRGDAEIQALVERADLVFRGRSSAAVMEMRIKTRAYERTYELVAWDDSRGGDRSLIKILGPAGYRGFGTLKLGEQLKLFDPKTNHVQVVGHSMLGGSWMGSHFSNDDLVKETRLARDYSASLLKTWTAPAPVGGPATHHLVALSPKPTAPVAWGRIEYELWENDLALVPVSSRYFRKAGDAEPARTITFTDVKEMSGRYVPSTLTVRLADKPGEETSLIYKKLKLNVDIPAEKFTEQSLRH